MSKSKNEYIRVRVGGNTLLGLAIYSILMMLVGSAVTTCAQKQKNTEYIHNVTKNVTGRVR